MTVAAGGSLQTRYAHAADRFRAAWVLHQFASGVSTQLLRVPLAYTIDFPRIHHDIRTVGEILGGTYPMGAAAMLDNIEEAIDATTATLLEADRNMHASHLRRFFDRLSRPEDAIIEYLIRFYFYADAVEGDWRDKVDFLFTRLGECASPESGAVTLRDPGELRNRIAPLIALLRIERAPRDEVARLVRALHSMRSEIESTAQFDDFTERNLLRDARTFKHRVGDLYFDPDVLIAIVELNLAAKNRFLRLYGGEEQRLVDEASRLMGDASPLDESTASNPELAREVEAFRGHWERFQKLRSESNVKIDAVAKLKTSLGAIVTQLERAAALDTDAPDPTQSLVDMERVREHVAKRFGTHEPLLDYCMRIDSALENVDPATRAEDLVRIRAVADLRLEPWEALAYQKLLGRVAPESDEDTEELWLLYVRSAALRIRADEEATILSTVASARVKPEPALMQRIARSLELAKELDESFSDLQQDSVYYLDRSIVRQIYRSRFRLLRTFSGLWLIYDQQS